MAKENSDRTTIDLFSEERRPGRPRTNPMPRETQIKVNKRNQMRRDKENGLRRIECKIHQQLLQRLNDEAKSLGVSRSELIEDILCKYLEESK